MATESPMRRVESSATVNWPSSSDTMILRSPLKDVAVEELRLLLKSQRLHGGDPTHVPNRSGSAPPSMEGSFAAFDYLVARQSSSQGSSSASLSTVIDIRQSEEQLRSHPAYVSYYKYNINRNPRLPPPLILRENRHLASHNCDLGNRLRAISINDSGNGFSHFSQSSLARRKEVDKSLPQLSQLQAENTTVLPGHDSASLTGMHKSIVDLIQEDFPRTPSPVYSQSRSSSLTETEDSIDHDVRVSSPNLLSRNISKEPEVNTTLNAACTTDTSPLFAAHASISTNDSLEASISKSSSPDMRSSQKPFEDTSTKCVGVEDDGALHLVGSCIEPRTRQKEETQQSHGRNMPQYYQSIQQGSAYQANVIAQGMSHSHGLLDNHNLGHSKSSTGAQPSLNSPGLTPPLYATAAYMTSGNSFYPNFQLSGPYAPQYNVGGYALSPTLVPPIMASFPSHAVVPGQFDSSPVSSPNNRSPGVSTGETVANGGHLQHLSRYYGQPGLVLQTSFISPFQMQYLQHPFGNIFGASAQQHGGRLESSGVSGCPANSVILNESFITDMADQKLHPLVNGNLSIPNPGKVGMIGNNYYGVPQSMGVVTQFTTSAFSSPVLQSSPEHGMNHLSRQNEMNFHQAPIRNVGLHSGWHGQRGVNSFNDSKRLSFLEELKSSNAQKSKLSDIAGRIAEFSVDQHGSRFIQQKLEHCSVEEKESVFIEVIPHAARLMTDVFGNYVIQKFFEHGGLQQRKELAEQLVGRMLPLSLQMYGCRVIQKALDVIEVDQMVKLVHELDGHVITCVHDQNGNHVIQKCIECLPVEKIEFVLKSFCGQITSLSTHPYGCRVIQRVLEHCSEGVQSQFIVDEILDAACVLSQDQYGNYVIQHVLGRGKPHERSRIINKLNGKIIQLSQHKYASNVVEKCLQYGDNAAQEILIWEIIGEPDKYDHLLIMMKDQFANYVIQKILDVCNDRQREILLNCVKTNLHALKKYTYGKHIAARFEQLSGEETQDCEEAEDESVEH